MIKTGEDAISFFAKYGNSTPIKFLFAKYIKLEMNDFNPYEL